MPSKGISRADFDDWKRHTTTQLFHQYLHDCAETTKETWEQGGFTSSESIEQTALLNAGAIGSIETIRQLQLLDWDDLKSFYGWEIEDEEAVDEQSY